MIAKLRNNMYMTLNEVENLGSIEIMAMTSNQDGVQPRNITCGSVNMNGRNIHDVVRSSFIKCVNDCMKPQNVININFDMVRGNSFDISTIINNFIKDGSREKFIIVATNIRHHGLFKQHDMWRYNIAESDDIKDEIIFGHKTGPNEPGVVIFTNEAGLVDVNNPRFSVSAIGLDPGRSYFNIKFFNTGLKDMSVDETRMYHGKTLDHVEEWFDEETRSPKLVLVFTDKTKLFISHDAGDGKLSYSY